MKQMKKKDWVACFLMGCSPFSSFFSLIQKISSSFYSSNIDPINPTQRQELHWLKIRKSGSGWNTSLSTGPPTLATPSPVPRLPYALVRPALGPVRLTSMDWPLAHLHLWLLVGLSRGRLPSWVQAPRGDSLHGRQSLGARPPLADFLNLKATPLQRATLFHSRPLKPLSLAHADFYRTWVFPLP